MLDKSTEICYTNIRTKGVRPMKAKTKTIPIEVVIKMMYKLLAPFSEPTDSLNKILIQRVLKAEGYEYE